MEMAFGILCAFLLLVLSTSLFLRRRKRRPEDKYKVPPGSMGWPYVGETLQLYSEDPSVFFATRQKRFRCVRGSLYEYGEIFKTHVLGCPCVILASPEAARFVLVTQAHLFKPTYPRSKERMIGPWALFFHHGSYHMRLRKLVQGLLSPNALHGLVPDIERVLSFDVGVLTIFGDRLEERHKVELKKNYSIVDKGYNSFPMYLPGTPYHKAVVVSKDPFRIILAGSSLAFYLHHLHPNHVCTQARKRLHGVLSEIMNERRKEGVRENDLLGCLIDSKDESGEHLNDDQIADNIIGVLFAAQHTTASVMTWVLKFLHDEPKLLESVRVRIWMLNVWFAT
ncbi:hypothetical protein BHE74_00011115 [Ensete ventricosum]|nr:hypothetical protein BHE74_00011115 [Ensete ventricosum]